MNTNNQAINAPHINILRGHLLATLADLRNRDNPMEPDRARAVAQVASVLVDTAKVENEYLKITGQDSSNFLAQPEQHGGLTRIDGPSAHNPFPSVLRHQLQG